jgi:hypothetical protein
MCVEQNMRFPLHLSSPVPPHPCSDRWRTQAIIDEVLRSRPSQSDFTQNSRKLYANFMQE